MQSPKHWQDPLNAAVGIVLAASPWLVGYAGVRMPAASALALGGVVALAAIASTFASRRWLDWVQAIAGGVAMLSPWLLEFSKRGDAMIVHLGLGAVAALLAASVLVSDDGPHLRLPLGRR